MPYHLRKIVTATERFMSPILAKAFYPPSGANIVCLHDDQIVVLDLGGKYNFPGGIINAKEHPKEAAKREFKEETGLDAVIEELICIKTKFNRITGINFFYKAKLDEEFKESSSSWEGKPVKVDKSVLRPEMQEIVNQA